MVVGSSHCMIAGWDDGKDLLFTTMVAVDISLTYLR